MLASFFTLPAGRAGNLSPPEVLLVSVCDEGWIFYFQAHLFTSSFCFFTSSFSSGLWDSVSFSTSTVPTPQGTDCLLLSPSPVLRGGQGNRALLVRVSITMTKKQVGEEKFYVAYTSRS